MRPAPFAFERHAFVEAVGRQLFVAVVGVLGREAVDVVALGLVAASREVAQVVGAVHVVLQRTVRFEGELPGVHAADRFAALVREADDPEPLPVGVGVLAQQGDDRTEVALAHGLHVADPFAAVDMEPDDEEPVDFGPCAVVNRLPAEHVGEGEVAVADARRHRISLDDGAVFEPDGPEFNHVRCSLSVRYGCNTAAPAPGSVRGGCRPRRPADLASAGRRCRRTRRCPGR